MYLFIISLNEKTGAFFPAIAQPVRDQHECVRACGCESCQQSDLESCQQSNLFQSLGNSQGNKATKSKPAIKFRVQHLVDHIVPEVI